VLVLVDFTVTFIATITVQARLASGLFEQPAGGFFQ
jgi:hypothetical protein